MDYKEEYNKKLAELKNTLRSLKENGIDVASIEEEVEKVTSTLELDCTSTMEYAVKKGTEYAIRYIDNCYKKATKSLNSILGDLRKILKETKDDVDYMLNLKNEVASSINLLDREGIKVGLFEKELKEIEILIGKGINSENDDEYERIYHEATRKLELLKEKIEQVKSKLKPDMTDEEKSVINATIKMEEYYEELDKRTNNYLEEDIRRIDADLAHMHNRANLGMAIGKLFISCGIIAGVLFTSIFASHKLSTTKKYKTKRTTYSSLTGEEKSEELYLDTNNKTLLVEVLPSNIESYDKNKPNVIAYDISSLGNMPLNELFNIDLRSLRIEGELDYRPVEENDILFNEAYEIVEKYIIDENDYETELNIGALIFRTSILIFLLLNLYRTIELGTLEIMEKFGKNVSYDNLFFKSIKEIMTYSKELKESKKPLIEEIEKVKHLKELIRNFFIEHKSEIDEAIITLRNSQNKDQKEEVNKILNRVCSLHRLLELDNIIKL